MRRRKESKDHVRGYHMELQDLSRSQPSAGLNIKPELLAVRIANCICKGSNDLDQDVIRNEIKTKNSKTWDDIKL